MPYMHAHDLDTMKAISLGQRQYINGSYEPARSLMDLRRTRHVESGYVCCNCLSLQNPTLVHERICSLSRNSTK
jgi:hypothetical protein